MENYPWDDWIPGVLSEKQLEKLCDNEYIKRDKCNKNAIDSSSMDLYLSDECYTLTKGVTKPTGTQNYLDYLRNEKLIKKTNSKCNGIFTLKPKKTYIFKICEKLDKNTLGENNFHGQATAKSSIGRVDVLVRLIIDGSQSYDCFTPEELKKGNGEMYLEVTPITFCVNVKPGIALSQLRLFYCEPENVEMKGKELCRTLLKNNIHEDGTITLDLSYSKNYNDNISAFCANPKKNKEPINLWTEKISDNLNKFNPKDYWETKAAKKDNNDNYRLTIKKSKFYILRSKERIRLPKGIAVYCRAIDETFGEMRIHYAGFVHPYFGYIRDNKGEGTPLIFEVRGHDIDVILRDGEKMAKLIFYRMSEDSKKPDEIPSYSNQELKLSKFFEEW